MKHLSSLLAVLLVSSVYYSQHLHCGTDEMHQQLYLNNVGLHQKVMNNNLELENFTQQFAFDYTQNSQNKGVISYTIPVVFHIIHNYGVENVSNAQVLDGLKILNEGYQKKNPDTSLLISPFKEIAADCEIEFRLAQLDPDGNCTSGITRHVDSSTYTGFHNVKEIVHWDPSKYLNIYITNQAAGLAGHALVPSAADTISEWDGIVLQHTYLGTVGTGSVLGARVIVHEVGHYLNLQHIWGGNNVPNYPYLPVGDAGNCAFDDGVTDTPNTIGNSGQNLGTSSCGSLDNMQNFMEYTYLNSMFTEGQKIRMHAALNSPIANRNNLWTQQNLIATGINGNSTICEVNMEASKQFICAGDSILFTDISFHGVTSRTWSFQGGTPSTANQESVYVTYNTPGVYEVQLTVNDASGSQSIIKTNYIEVFETPANRTALLEGFEGMSTLENSHWFTDQESWEVATNVGKNSDQSVVLTNFNDFSGRISSLVSKPIDVSNANNLVLSFDYAFTKKTNALSSDRLKVYVSKNCGKTWLTRKTLSATFLSTTAPLSTEFVPSNSEWKNASVTNISSGYYSNKLMVKFEFKSGGGNHIYIDNVNLFDPSWANVTENLTSKLTVYPNPSKGVLTIKTNKLLYKAHAYIYDLSGKLIFDRRLSENATETELNVQNLAKGTYIVQVGTARTKLSIN